VPKKKKEKKEEAVPGVT